MENCEDPPVFLSESITGAENVTWDEPVFYDNSGLPIKIEKSHIPGKETFPMGQTQVIYNATDQFGNTKSCIFNITVEGKDKKIIKKKNLKEEITAFVFKRWHFFGESSPEIR